MTEPFLLAEEGGTRGALEWVAEAALISALCFGPFAYGLSEAWSQLVFLALVGLAGLATWGHFLTRPQASARRTPVLLPIILFILLAVFQLVSMSSAELGVVSPSTASVRRELAGLEPQATLSFYPYATTGHLRLLLGVSAVFIVTLNLYREPARIRQLLAAITALGAAVAGVALYIQLDRSGYGRIPANQALSGPFVNHSHFAQFVNLSIGAALGLLLVLIHPGQGRGRQDWKAWGVSGGILIGCVSVFLSMSRGGMLSLLLAAGMTLLLMAWRLRSSGRAALVATLALGTLGVLLLLGFDSVYDRLATLRHVENAQGGRWQIVKDLSRAWRLFPVFGTGLGTHEQVFPMFDRAPSHVITTHAENEYAQLMLETGIAGVLACMVFVGCVFRNCLAAVWTPRRPIHFAAYGLSLGWVAILLHSLSDFGQHMPAVAALTAVTAALIINIGHIGSPAERSVVLLSDRALQHRRIARVCGFLATLGTWGWVMIGASGASSAQAAWNHTLAEEHRICTPGRQTSPDDFRSLAALAERALAYAPGDAELRYWKAFYEWQAVSFKPGPGPFDFHLSDADRAEAVRILSDLTAATHVCPTYAPLYALGGEIDYFALGHPGGAALVRTGARLGANDPYALFACAYLEATTGEVESSLDVARRALELDGSLTEQVVDLYALRLENPEAAHGLVAGNRPALATLASALRRAQRSKDWADRCDSESRDLLVAEATAQDAPPQTLAAMADLCRREGRANQAIEYYRRALDRDYGQLQWRMGLAEALAGTGRHREAIKEARVCLNLRPRYQPAEKLIADQSLLE